MQTAVAKWGNSLALRLPRSIAEGAKLYEGTQVKLSLDGNALVIRPARPKYKLSELLEQMTSENQHGEVDWGPPQGEEEW